MQPTDTQVACSLAALRLADEGPASTLAVVEEHASPMIPIGLVDDLLAGSSIRPDRLAAAMARVAAGDQPSADDLASRMVGRLVCDRLR